MKWVYIADLADHIGEQVELRGWLYNRRGNKNLHFLQVRDGTGFVQAVMDASKSEEKLFEQFGAIGIESSIKVRGEVVKDERSKLGVELQVTDAEVIQEVHDYPIQITKDVPNIEKLLDIRHLWMRSPKARAVLKIRSEVIQATRQFYYERGFSSFDSPIFTPNACEGTSTLFETEYFGEPMYLSQSGQLYGEAGAMALGKVVVFGPTFRAEKSKTRRHLTEFWMVEPEVAFAEIDEVMDLAEDSLAYIVKWVLRTCRDELETLERDIAKLEAVQKPFPRIHYKEAQELLQTLKRIYQKGSNQDEEAMKLPDICGLGGKTCRFPKDASNKEIKRIGSDIMQNGLGDDLGAADETALSMQFDAPVLIHRYPAEVKAFYMRRDPEDPQYALCVDVIAPEGYGEIIGGAEREIDHDFLVEQIKKHGLPLEAFDWFLDLRKFGSVPHGGFGMGVERVVQWLSGSHHVREAIPFPRTMVRMKP